MLSLKPYGWNDTWNDVWKTRKSNNDTPARVIAEYGTQYKIAAPQITTATFARSASHKLSAHAMPKVGDWVAVEMLGEDKAVIHTILPRTSEIARSHPGNPHTQQIMATNVDIAFIMQPLDHDFSPERLERYLFQLASQKIDAIILLNKADTVTDAAKKQALLQNLGVETMIMSALQPSDVQKVAAHIPPGKTAVIMGSSGAGKSTLINQLLGEERQATQQIREQDSKGRHTTVHRELFILPGGGMIIDTPGIRELQLWGSYDDLEKAFPEITAAIHTCHYPHCSHTNEKGCAVLAGLANASIDPVRYKRFVGFKAELEQLDQKRGFIAHRKQQRTHETAKRLLARKRRAEEEKFDDWNDELL